MVYVNFLPPFCLPCTSIFLPYFPYKISSEYGTSGASNLLRNITTILIRLPDFRNFQNSSDCCICSGHNSSDFDMVKRCRRIVLGNDVG